MSFLRKGILVSGANLASTAITMVVGIIFARALGPEGIGQYQLFLTTATLVGTVFALGIGNANIYFLNNHKVPIERITTDTLKIGTLLGFLMTVGLAMAVLAIPRFFGPVTITTAILFGCGAALGLGTNILRPILVAQLRTFAMIAPIVLRSVGLFGGAVLLAPLGLLSTDSAIGVLSLSRVAEGLLVITFLAGHCRIHLPLDWPHLGRLVRYGLKLTAVDLMYLLSSQSTVVLLRLLRPDDFGDLGLYSRAVAVAGLVTLVPLNLGQLLYAKFASVAGETRTQQAEMACRMNVAYGLTACIGLVLAGPYLIGLLYGREFVPANDALQLLAPALVFMTLFGVCNNLLASDGRAAWSAWILAGAVLITIVVTSLSVPPLGIRGAALGVLCGNAFTALVSFGLCRGRYGLHLRRCLVLRRSDIVYMRQSLIPR